VQENISWGKVPRAKPWPNGNKPLKRAITKTREVIKARTGMVYFWNTTSLSWHLCEGNLFEPKVALYVPGNCHWHNIGHFHEECLLQLGRIMNEYEISAIVMDSSEHEPLYRFGYCPLTNLFAILLAASVDNQTSIFNSVNRTLDWRPKEDIIVSEIVVGWGDQNVDFRGQYKQDHIDAYHTLTRRIMKNLEIPTIETRNKRILYITRKDERRRKVLNEDDFLAELRKSIAQYGTHNDLVIMDPSKHSIWKQLWFWHNSDIFITERSAAMVGTMYMKPGGVIIYSGPPLDDDWGLVPLPKNVSILHSGAVQDFHTEAENVTLNLDMVMANVEIALQRVYHTKHDQS